MYNYESKKKKQSLEQFFHLVYNDGVRKSQIMNHNCFSENVNVRTSTNKICSNKICSNTNCMLYNQCNFM